MSRIFVKNLPKKATNNRLRDFFSQKGEVTDAKILLTSDGKSRQIAFVGFRSEGEAEAAIKYFNNSYLDTSKITCELAHKIGDPKIPRSQGRHSAKKQEELNDKKKGSTYGKSLGPLKPEREVKKAKKSTDDDDSLFQEFLQVSQPRSQSKIWANDTVANPLLKNSKTSLKETQSLKEGKTSTVKKQDKLDEKEKNLIVTRADPARDVALSDMDYFKSRVKKALSDSDSEQDSDSDLDSVDVDEPSGSLDGKKVHKVVAKDLHDHTADNSQENDKEDTLKSNDDEMNESGNALESGKDEMELVRETGRLFVRNLPYTATEDDLRELFQKYGDLSEVHLVLNKDTKRSKGFAYILYALPECAVSIIKEVRTNLETHR